MNINQHNSYPATSMDSCGYQNLQQANLQPFYHNNFTHNIQGFHGNINMFDPRVIADTEIKQNMLKVLQVQKKFYEQEVLANLLQTLENKYFDLGTQQIEMFTNEMNIANTTIKHYIPHEMYAIARHLGKTTNTDIFSCVMSLLAATAIAMRGRYRVLLERHWAEMLNLYILIAKNSGQKKSALCEMVKDPHRNFLSRRRKPETPKKDRRSQMQPTLLKAAKESERAVIARHTREIRKSGESITHIRSMIEELKSVKDEFPDDIPPKHTREEIFVDVITSLALVKKLERNGETIAMMEPEAGMFLSKFFKDKSLVPILLKCYGGEPYQYDTSTQGNCVYLERPSINILLLLQNNVMFKLFDNDFLVDIGLFPRTLPIFGGNFIYDPSDSVTFDYPRNDQDWMALYEEKIMNILEFTYTQDTNREIFDIACEPSARSILLDFERDNIKSIESGQYRHMTAFIRKLHGTAARIAGCIHGWTFPRPHEHPITVKEMEAAIALAKICRDHANIAFDTKSRETVHFAIKILKHLLKQDWSRSNPLISASDLQRSIRGMNSAKCLLALEFLEQHNFIRVHHEPGHAPLCILHPNLFQVNLGHLTDI